MLKRIKTALRFLYPLPLVDCVSTLYAMSYGGQEQIWLPALFIKNWGSIGLVIFDILVLAILLLILELFIFRVVSKSENQKIISMNKVYRIAGKMWVLVLLFVCGAISFWISIIVSNFTFPLFLQAQDHYVLQLFVLLVSYLVLAMFIRSELLYLWVSKEKKDVQ